MSYRSLSLFSRAVVTIALVLLTASLASAQGFWTHVGDLPSANAYSAAVTLDDGRVLVVGGVDYVASALAISQVFDPVTGTVTAVPMFTERYAASAVKLGNGKVLAFGGTGLSGAAMTSEIFNPVTNSWSSLTATPLVTAQGGAHLLPDGRVLAIGDHDTALYDPSTNSWTLAASMTETHYFAASVRLSDGRILVVGGDGSTISEVYDPSAGTWSAAAGIPSDGGYIQAVTLPDGRVLAAGGRDTSYVEQSRALLYDPDSDTWSPAGNMSNPRAVFTLQVMPTGQVVASGGIVSTSSLVETASTDIYTPSTNLWTASTASPVAHSFNSSAVAGPALYVFGGLLTKSIDAFRDNLPPVANAGSDVVANGCLTCTTGVVVSGAGSSDPDGQPLTFTWSLAATTLAVTTSPQTDAALPLGVGTYDITLTVRDTLGAEDTDTVHIVVTDVDTAYLDQIAALQTALGACEASSGGGGDIDPEMNSLEQFFRTTFRNASFELPGSTADEELQALIEAIEDLDHDAQMKLYRELGGRKGAPDNHGHGKDTKDGKKDDGKGRSGK